MDVSPRALRWREGWRSRVLRYRLLFRLIVLQLRLRKRLFVLLRVAGMGDVIATLPACAELAKRHPDRQLVYVTNPHFVPIIEMAGLPLIPVTDQQGTLPSLSRFFFASCWLSCADDFYRQPDTTFVQDFAQSCGVTVSPGERPRLHLPAELERAVAGAARELAGGRWIAALHLGPSDPVREWPRAHWVELVEQLNALGACVVQLGVSYHTRWGSRDIGELPGAHSLLDRLSLPETACWLKQSRIFIGIDSGLLQMAVAVDCPVVALTGPTDMRFRLAAGTPGISLRVDELPCIGCHHRPPRLHWNTGCPFDIACMQRLAPARVAAAVTVCLAERESISA